MFTAGVRMLRYFAGTPGAAAGKAAGCGGCAATEVAAGAALAAGFGASRFTAPYRAASHSRTSEGL